MLTIYISTWIPKESCVRYTHFAWWQKMRHGYCVRWRCCKYMGCPGVDYKVSSGVLLAYCTPPLTVNHSLLLSVTSQRWSHLLLSYRPSSTSNMVQVVEHKVIQGCRSLPVGVISFQPSFCWLPCLPSDNHLFDQNILKWLSCNVQIRRKRLSWWPAEVTLSLSLSLGFVQKTSHRKLKTRNTALVSKHWQVWVSRVTLVGKLSVIVSTCFYPPPV